MAKSQKRHAIVVGGSMSGLLAALIAILALGAVASVGTTIQTVFWSAIAAAA